MVAAEAGLEVAEYSPSEVKSAVTGIGDADKEQVRMALARRARLRDVPSQPDAADAAAGAVTPGRRGARAGRRPGDRPSRAATISFVEGEVVEKTANRVVLNVGGVGYDLQVPTSVVGALPPIGRATRVHTRMVVRDDSMTLYGFMMPDERGLFDLLTGVTGVGPKVALSFLSALSPTRSAGRSSRGTPTRSPWSPAWARRSRNA